MCDEVEDLVEELVMDLSAKGGDASTTHRGENPAEARRVLRRRPPAVRVGQVPSPRARTFGEA